MANWDEAVGRGWAAEGSYLAPVPSRVEGRIRHQPDPACMRLPQSAETTVEGDSELPAAAHLLAARALRRFPRRLRLAARLGPFGASRRLRATVRPHWHFWAVPVLAAAAPALRGGGAYGLCVSAATGRNRVSEPPEPGRDPAGTRAASGVLWCRRLGDPLGGVQVTLDSTSTGDRGRSDRPLREPGRGPDTARTISATVVSPIVGEGSSPRSGCLGSVP